MLRLQERLLHLHGKSQCEEGILKTLMRRYKNEEEAMMDMVKGERGTATQIPDDHRTSDVPFSKQPDDARFVTISLK